MISVEISTRGLEFDEVAEKLSGPLKQKLQKAPQQQQTSQASGGTEIG